MNQRIVDVILSCGEDDTDILQFSFADDMLLSVNLNSPECQNDLKKIFSETLRMLTVNDVSFNLAIAEGYSRQMYIEVCQEYVKDLNRELNEIKASFREQIS